jgi:hypothetical protein
MDRIFAREFCGVDHVCEDTCIRIDQSFGLGRYAAAVTWPCYTVGVPTDEFFRKVPHGQSILGGLLP